MKKPVKKCKCCGMAITPKYVCACDKSVCNHCCDCKMPKKKPAAEKTVKKKTKK